MYIPHWRKSISSEEVDIGIRNCGRKIHVDIINEEVEGSSSEEEEIGISKCSRRSGVVVINE